MRTPSTSCLLLALLAVGCDCRSREEVAEQIFEQAMANTSPREPEDPWDVRPLDESRACDGGPGTLSVPIAAGILLDFQVWEGSFYWAGSSYFSRSREGDIRELGSTEWPVRWFRVDGRGVFAVVQSETTPVRTRLEVFGPDDERTRSLERDDVLLHDPALMPEGLYALAARVLGSPGPSAQLLHHAEGEQDRVVLDIEHAAMELQGEGSDLYWLEYPQQARRQMGLSAVVAYDLERGERRVLTERTATRLWPLALSDTHVLWVERTESDAAAGVLMRVPKAGGEAEQVHSGVRPVSVLAAGESAYVQLSPADPDVQVTQVHRIDLATGEATLVLDEPDGLGLLRLEDGVLYWATRLIGEGSEQVRCLRAMPLPDDL